MPPHGIEDGRHDRNYDGQLDNMDEKPDEDVKENPGDDDSDDHGACHYDPVNEAHATLPTARFNHLTASLSRTVAANRRSAGART